MSDPQNTERRPRREGAPVRRRPAKGEVAVVDTTDSDFLRRFVTEQGKILPIRLTGLTAKQQRQLKHGIRRARTLGLLP